MISPRPARISCSVMGMGCVLSFCADVDWW
jgi:hypothetical protein